MIAVEQRPRILIVEDEPAAAADLEASINGLGYESVGIVTSGTKAVQAARESSPDVILIEIRLKGTMDGVSAAEVIRRNWNIPVIFITADPNDALLRGAGTGGSYGYILKPFRTKDLKATILLALKHHRLARELFSERTWLTVLQSLSDGVIGTDTEGRVRYLNSAAEVLAGCALDDALGRPIEDVYRLTTMANEALDRYPLHEALHTRSTAGKHRFLLHARGGMAIPIEETASPIEAAGEMVGAVTVFVDIAERVRREREAEREQHEESVQRPSQALGETRAELRALSGCLMKAQEEERRQVARELHDDLSQRAAMVEMELERMKPLLPKHEVKVDRLLEEIRRQIARLSAGLREVSHQLRPGVIEDLGLPAALRQLVQEYSQNNMEVSFVERTIGREVPLEVATALYRIAQEGLWNAAKHAPGAPVRLLLEEKAGELCFVIEDAGPGFDIERARGKGGLGLLCMQERARLVGGRMLLRTRPGESTLILVRVPLADPVVHS